MASISDSDSQWWECQRKTGVCSMCEVPCVHTQLRTSPRAAQGLSPARIDLRGKFTWRIGLRVQRKGCLCAHLPQKVSLLPGQGSETEKKRFLCDTPLPLIFLQVLGTLLRMPLIWNENKNGVSLPSEPFLQSQSHLVLAGATIHEHFQQFQMEELPFFYGRFLLEPALPSHDEIRWHHGKFQVERKPEQGCCRAGMFSVLCEGPSLPGILWKAAALWWSSIIWIWQCLRAATAWVLDSSVIISCQPLALQQDLWACPLQAETEIFVFTEMNTFVFWISAFIHFILFPRQDFHWLTPGEI